jgi:hypothetical protein
METTAQTRCAPRGRETLRETAPLPPAASNRRPVVFLFGAWVQTPILIGKGGLPFWLALFIGNIVSVLLLNWLVPWVSRGFGWWLAPKKNPGIGATSQARRWLLYCTARGSSYSRGSDFGSSPRNHGSAVIAPPFCRHQLDASAATSASSRNSKTR